jgi:hypothetical protein
MKRVLLAGTLAIGLVPPAAASTQATEVLIVDGQKLDLILYPLEPYFDRFPERRDRLKPQPDAEGRRVEIQSTALYRGYIGTWEIASGRLVLRDLRVERVSPAEAGGVTTVSALDDLFPGNGPTFADWYTGYLLIPGGGRQGRIHFENLESWERYRLMRVEGGLLVDDRTLDTAGFEAFRRAQFDAFKRTAEYREALAKAEAYEAGRRRRPGDPSPGEAAEQSVFVDYSTDYLARIFDAAP